MNLIHEWRDQRLYQQGGYSMENTSSGVSTPPPELGGAGNTLHWTFQECPDFPGPCRWIWTKQVMFSEAVVLDSP